MNWSRRYKRVDVLKRSRCYETVDVINKLMFTIISRPILCFVVSRPLLIQFNFNIT